MKFASTKPQPVDPHEWHRAFAWLPTRINDHCVIWLESYERKLVTVCEGNWAGGYQWRWDKRTAWGEWQGKVQGY